MAVSANTKRKLETVAIVSAAGLMIGPVFVALAFGFESYRIAKGMIGGFLITSISAAMEAFVFEEKLKRLRFSWVLLVRSISYVLVISFSTILVVAVHESMEHQTNIFDVLAGEEFAEFLRGDFVSIFIFSVVTSFTINLLWQMNKLLGKGVLLNYVTGRYHTPRDEERIFMFLDLKSSTTIAEGIDPVTYHRFMNEYFFDINEPILKSKGEIYQYVGDEVVVSWRTKDGIADSNCIQCFFRIQDRIAQQRDKYLRKYGVVPEFKAGMHCGTVVVGEVGDSKKEIVFHGDVMNTASRIQSQCNVFNVSLLISEDLLNRMKVDKSFNVDPIGSIRLKGKQHEVKLFSVSGY